MRHICVLAATISVGFSSFASASLLLVGGQLTGQSNGGGKALAPTVTAGVDPQANWNVLAGQTGGPTSLVGSTGAGTGISVSWTSDDSWTTGTSANGPNGAGDPTLLSGEDKTRSTATYTLSNVPAGTYNLILYTVNDVENIGSSTSEGETIYNDDQTGTEWNNNPVYVPSTASSAAAAATVGPTNYLVLTALTPVGGEIVFTHSFAQAVGSDTVAYNGFQLVQTSVPEPAAISVLGLAGLGLLAGRRRT